MKVAVTGATGSLGRSLAESLVTAGFDVVALGRNAKVGDELQAYGATFCKADIASTADLTKAFDNCDAVVHCAGLASPWGPWESFLHANVEGTRAVLEAMKASGVPKLVHISTPSLYFTGRPRTEISESEPLPEQITFYGKSKLMADELVIAAVAKRDLDALLIRPRAIYGKYDTTIVPRLLKVMERGIFPLPNGGDSLVDLTAVENVVHAIRLALESKKRFDGAAVNITDGEPMSVRVLTQKLADMMGFKVRFLSVPLWVLVGLARISESYSNLVSHREPSLSRYGIESIGITQTLSLARARELLGFQPIVSTEEAIRKLGPSLRN